MRIMVIEGTKNLVEKVEAAVRLRWPNAHFIATSFIEAFGQLQKELPDIVMISPSEGLIEGEEYDNIKSLRERAPHAVPLVALGTENTEVVIKCLLELELDDYIDPDSSLAVLMERINALVRRKQPHLSAAA